jgi:hypothetical protein
VIPLLDETVQQVAIDGKTLRRAHNSRQDLDPLHAVSALDTELGVSLGQVAPQGQRAKMRSLGNM